MSRVLIQNYLADLSRLRLSFCRLPKDKVIDLLARVARVSVETQRIVEAMRSTVC